VNSFVTTTNEKSALTIQGGANQSYTGPKSIGGPYCATPVHLCPSITKPSFGPTFCGGVLCWIN